MKQELKSIGMTDGEIEVYLTLLKLGESTNSPIARHAQLQSSTVYYCLNSLIEKGFVSYILKGSRKHFRALNPETIPKILEEKEKELKENKKKIEKIIPYLKEFQGELKEKTSAEVYEGIRGFRMIFRQILEELKKGDSYHAFVIEQALTEPKEIQLVFTHHNKELKRKGIKLYLLAPEKMRLVFEKIYGKKFLKSYQEVRYTKEITPAGITIYKNNVITHLTEDNKPISIKVKNKKLAEMYWDYFKHVWDHAKP
ncbi:hypothetical protein GF386_01975 [Candidatus Pacearchaeota archaeon]|nr:hypothetical protein [Candidatus Pacearchaeota archaeon]MBD3282941.1 hypothetical protein [Candidatus Pacearchaeota archaeon]